MQAWGVRLSLQWIVDAFVGPHRGHRDDAVVGLAVAAQPLPTDVGGAGAVLEAVADVEHRSDERDHPNQRPPLILDIADAAGPACSRCCNLSTFCSLSSPRAPPDPFDAKAFAPPASHARRHEYADFV